MGTQTFRHPPMILADTSIWVDHLRSRDSEMVNLLGKAQIVMHPFIVAEIALGSLHNRRKRLDELEALLEVRVAQLSEVRHMIEAHSLYSRGIGLTDAHLAASCLITPGTQLWTRDGALLKVAKSLGIHANLP
jgi:predicted nucleic acid-binding protein